MEKLLFIISFSILYFSSLILVLKKENNQIIKYLDHRNVRRYGCIVGVILFWG